MKQISATLFLFFVIAASAYAQSDTTDIKSIILKETKEGGKLDFFTPIKDHEYDAVQIKPGVITTKLAVATIAWGKANYEMGVKTLEEAYAIYSLFKGRELNVREKEYIKIGYNREL